MNLEPISPGEDRELNVYVPAPVAPGSTEVPPARNLAGATFRFRAWDKREPTIEIAKDNVPDGVGGIEIVDALAGTLRIKIDSEDTRHFRKAHVLQVELWMTTPASRDEAIIPVGKYSWLTREPGAVPPP